MRRRNAPPADHERAIGKAIGVATRRARASIASSRRGDRDAAFWEYSDAVQSQGALFCHISSLPRKSQAVYGRDYDEVSTLINQAAGELRKSNPRRPAKSFMKHCTRAVKKTGVRDPNAVCASQYQKLSSVAKRRWEHTPNPYRVGSRVSAVNIRDGRTGRAVAGVFTIMRKLASGDVVIRRSDGQTYQVPTSNLRLAKNPLEPGGGVELHAVTYKERKAGDKSPQLYEHEFEGKRKPRLAYNGRDLKIKRAGSRYTVKQGWIHG